MNGAPFSLLVCVLIVCLATPPLWTYPVAVSNAPNAPSPDSPPAVSDVYTPDPTTTASLCNVTGDGNTTVSDVQLEVNEALGSAPPANDLDMDGSVNIVDVQIVLDAVLGSGCSAATTLTITISGTGTGTVGTSLPGTSCGSVCLIFSGETIITLTATPATGSTFAGWSGACSGTGSCVLTMNSNQAVTATFNLTANDILTAQIDSARSMANASEIYLTTSTVNVSRFGKLFTRSVDGAIFAQPLYLTGAMIGGKKTNIVYVATSHDNVYAFDADNPSASTPIWTANLGTYDTPSGWLTGMGITGTPVIVRAQNAIYVVAATQESGSRVYRLHALDLLTGAEKFSGPMVISGSVTSTSADAVNGNISFLAQYHVQRTGIALSGNQLIIAFSSDRDHAPYHGWVFSYNTSLQPTGVYSDNRSGTMNNGDGDGIWQSGRAPAVDANGTVYLETGNGTWDGTTSFGESFLKLSAVSGLSLTDWFTPVSWAALNSVDYDLSSTGPTLIPGTNLLFGGSKSGTIYLLSTTNLGQMSTSDANIVQEFTATSGCVVPFVGQGCAQIMGHAFWSTASVPTLYVWGVHDVLRSYSFSSGHFNTTPSFVGTSQSNYPGGVLSLSSYLDTSGTGILWAITADTPDEGDYFGPGVTPTASLHAFDASNPSNELWNSDQNATRDTVGVMASFAPPVATNGKVYVPTFSNELVVYGLLAGPVPGDVNGDTVVNCTDMSIVKASFGKSTGQPGFDPRADVNGDGIVNILDLAFVSQHLPNGLACD
jgi:hypothetical protein